MSRDSWYRNTTWNSEISDVFEGKLKRARSNDSKAQYLRIQAHYLFTESDIIISVVGEKLMHRVIEEYYNEVSDSVFAMVHLADHFPKYPKLCSIKSTKEEIDGLIRISML